MPGKNVIKKSTVILLTKELEKTFARKTELARLSDNTAADEDVDRLLDEVFGKQP